ncbi:uncharacterized protein UTRI_05503_B [Ustilago trichophora]|uniref:DNA replication regulator Sld3 C-terminal domain-containing protein n=1 Tax=Ustilago trichophora TaxID=86804 RepID=A0A5C3EK24_9BASI|nr:uncharacterized protein UTRI_05503_B [Ustilago trichophora]
MVLMASPDGTSVQCEAGPSRLVQDAPKPLAIRYACHLEQLEGESWFGINDKPPPIAQHRQLDTTAHDSLADRYTETLWLGEFHTGLSHFLNCIDRLRSSHELEEILLGLCQLIRSNSSISRRHQAASRALLPHCGLTTEQLAKEMQDLTEYEKILVQQAVDKAGSGQISSQVANGNADTLRERWVSSMESREIQLQILVTLCLLQIVSEEPRALEIARSRATGTSQAKDVPMTSRVVGARDKESEQPRKRSRKLEKAKRWQGSRPQADSGDAFAWNQSVRRRLATDSSHDDGESGEGEVLEMEGGEVLAVDHLSKRVEALVDILCLRQVAAGVGSEMSDLLWDVDGETMGNERDGLGGAKARGMLFGSSVRKLVEDDDMDDAQWLCSSVVEPHFEASLPRQCSLFRSKCFVSLQSRTPARPTKSARKGSFGSPPSRCIKRSASIAPAGTHALLAGGDLSDVLEKEQAGRRVKRHILAERSSILGRGREVDMGRRLSRSVSATSGAGREPHALGGVFSRSNTNALFTQPKSAVFARPFEARSSVKLGQEDGRAVSQKAERGTSMRTNGLCSTPSFGASSSKTSKRLLVMSTPQKEGANKKFNLNHLSQLDKPRLVYPNSLVMESPTQKVSQVGGERTRIAERCASFGGRSSFQLNRSPSPVAVYSDVDE